jgi:4'-phosphopantetheinyl transferase
MPIEHIHKSHDRIWGFWRILEEEPTLTKILPFEKISDAIINPLKRLEFLSGRVLIQSLLKNWGVEYAGITKNIFGKPFLLDSDIHLSLSHSYPYVAAILHRKNEVGIDLEQPKEKLLKIAPRVLAAAEMKDAGSDVVKHCIYWCAKESLIKIYGKKDLVFARDLLITPFSRNPEGDLIGRIVANNSETAIPLHYIVYDNFVVVVSN